MIRALSTILILIVFVIPEYSQDEETKCSELTVKGPSATIRPGKVIRFEATLTPAMDPSRYEITWNVEGGEIIEGQGTLAIQVSYPGRGGDVRAYVEISGLGECNRAGGDAYIDEFGSAMPILIDEWLDPMTGGEIKARIDNLAVEVFKDKDSRGYIVSYGSGNEVIRRHSYLLWYIQVRSYATNRFVFIYKGNEKKIRTRLWVVPADADPTTVN